MSGETGSLRGVNRSTITPTIKQTPNNFKLIQIKGINNLNVILDMNIQHSPAEMIKAEPACC